MNLIARMLEEWGVLFLDGGTATRLEEKGFDIADPLWSSKVLIDRPDAIEEIHREYLESGSDLCTSVSYQATVSGFMDRGCTRQQAEGYLRASMELAVGARNAFWERAENRAGRPRPVAAASIGPYGAFLADGSEYTGNYPIGREELRAFHRDRMALLVQAGAELLACETVPSLEEALVLAQLAGEQDGISCWISFSCRDDAHISEGTPIEDCARALEQYEHVAAVGVNCLPPQWGEALVGRIAAVTQKPVVIYPNSGEEYDAADKIWRGAADGISFEERALSWYKAGARLIGGCCRTGPGHIRRVAERLAGARRPGA